jgi:hypothetical protein
LVVDGTVPNFVETLKILMGDCEAIIFGIYDGMKFGEMFPIFLLDFKLEYWFSLAIIHRL